MASRGKGARAKGANFERDLAKYFRESLLMDAQRGLGQCRGGGEEIADVEMDLIHIEAKRHKRCHIKAAMNQAIEDSKNKNKFPVAITKDDRKPILVTMLLEDWTKIFKEYAKSKE